MWKEFKKFILRGNVIDLAIGVVMGSAFSAIVNGLVNDIIMPVAGFITAGISFTDLKYVIRKAVMDGETVVKPELAITYGHLIQVTIQFLIIAAVIFLVVKAINHLREKIDEKLKKAPTPTPAKPADVVLLEEIRDLLKKADQ